MRLVILLSCCRSKTRKTAADSSAPPNGLVCSFLPWRRAAAPFALLIMSGALASADVVVTVSPLLQTASLGSTATVEIGISGLGLNAAPSLGAYDLNIAFNPAVLSFSSLTFGDPVHGDQLDLSGAGAVSDFSSPSAGQLEFFEISLDSAAILDTQQSGDFILATVAFTAIGAGNSSLLPGVNSIGDSLGAPLSADLQSGSINVVTTPEPNTFVALVSLAVLLAWRGNRCGTGKRI